MRMFDPLRQKLGLLTAKIPTPSRIFDPAQRRLDLAATRLRPADIKRGLDVTERRLEEMNRRAEQIVSRKLDQLGNRLKRAGGLLEAYSYQGVLQRGYALVTDEGGSVVRSKDEPVSGDKVTLTFADGKRGAVIDGEGVSVPVKAKPKSKPKPKPKKPDTGFAQGDLF